MKKILFLDFDGVLHPAQGNNVPEFSLVGPLDSTFVGHACDLVISSTWRDHYSLADLRRFLGASLGKRVIGVLGPDGRGRFLREQAIEAWLGELQAEVDWRALDDTESEFTPSCKRLILCDGARGIQERELQMLREWITNS